MKREAGSKEQEAVRNQITEFLNSSIGNSSIPKSLKAISPEMAIRLSIAFDTTPESWLNQQLQYDLRRAEQRRGELRVKRLTAA